MQSVSQDEAIYTASLLDDDDSLPYDDDDEQHAFAAFAEEQPLPTSQTALTPVTRPAPMPQPQSQQPQPQPAFSARQLALIKSTLAPGIDDDQLALFALVAERTGLDPFQRQIYAVLRNTKEGKNWVKKMTIQTGIDGYLAIAERSGSFAGVDDIVFDTEDGEHPNRATATVWRWSANGQRIPFTYTARYREYVQEKDEYRDGQKTGKKVTSDMWARMPWTMLGKCALARALRQGFPAQLSGIYTSEEMMQADSSLLTGEIVESDPASAASAAPVSRKPQSQQPQQRPVATGAPVTLPQPVAWNPLGDSPFRRRCNIVGVKTIADVDQMLRDADALTEAEGVYHKSKALAYLTNLEAQHAEASAQARKAAQS